MNEKIHNQLITKGYYATKINPNITEKLKEIFSKIKDIEFRHATHTGFGENGATSDTDFEILEELKKEYAPQKKFQFWYAEQNLNKYLSITDIEYLKSEIFINLLKQCYPIDILTLDSYHLSYMMYNKQCYINPHQDGLNKNKLCNILLYLNEDYKDGYGGELVINNNVVIKPEFGTLVVLDFTTINPNHSVTEVLDGKFKRLSIVTSINKNKNMHKGKGIIFMGCSITWGGGLEYYAPFKDIPNPYAFQYDERNITFAIMNFIKANRFSRLVANHFEMWESNRINCGGSDDKSIEEVKMMLSLGNYSEGNIYKQFENIKLQKYSPDEIEYVVFQLTDPFRNCFININGEKLGIVVPKNRNIDTNEFNKNDIYKFNEILDDETFNKFFKFYTDNFNSWKEMEDYFILENLKGVIELFKEVESLGIKCKVWSWHTEYVPFIKENDYLSSKFIKLKYDDTEFDCLYDLMKVHPKFKISTSGFLVNGKPVPDDHQTIECHNVIADSIINSIEKDDIKIITDSRINSIKKDNIKLI